MTQVQVTFWAPAAVYQEILERDMDFHEQHGQLTGLQIMVHEPPQAIVTLDLTGDEPSPIYPGKGIATDPILLDDDGWTHRIPHAGPVGPECVICQDTLSAISQALPCGHTFCRTCIRKWYRPGGPSPPGVSRVNKTCPLCKHPFARRDIF